MAFDIPSIVLTKSAFVFIYRTIWLVMSISSLSRAYVNYYQWLSPFHPELKEYCNSLSKKIKLSWFTFNAFLYDQI